MTMYNKLIILLVFFFSLALQNAFSQTTEQKVLTLAEAQQIADAAEKRANQDKWNVVIAIVDAGGHLICLRRMDGTQIGSVEVANQKAKTSLYFKRPTKVFQDLVSDGNNAVLALPNVIASEGGLPIFHEEKIIGAIGVSGVTSAQDGIIAQSALEALND
jgi:uncharacterized protein GlcG (DUF336 family)